MTEPTSVAVMLSGNGSNLNALADYARATNAFHIAGVISDRGDAYGLQRAKKLGLAAARCVRGERVTPDEHETDILATLEPWAPSVVVLAGYMRILGPKMVSAYRGRLVNVHPSLLPKYRGLHTYRRALEAGDTEHGASVHYVTEELDGGPVIAQARVPITANETEQTLCAKVQTMEYQLYPLVVHALATGALTLQRDRVYWRDNLLTEPLDVASLQEALA